MTSFAMPEGLFFTLDEDIDIEYPTAFKLVVRGVIHRKGFINNREYYVLEWDEQLAELFGEDVPILEFEPIRLHKYAD